MSFAEEIGTVYRKGNYATLNLYIGGRDSNDSFGSFPLPNILTAAAPPVSDGVFLTNLALPGNDPGGCCNLGKVLTHEVGHWLSLLHTFATSTPGSKCDPKDKNDYISDTPQQAAATDFICPADGTDTCPLLPGLDPIHNYMDYSSDECYNQFTPQQIARMFASWSIYRKKDEVCAAQNSLFELKLRTDDFPAETSWTLKSTDGKLSFDFTFNNNPIENEYDKKNFDYDQELCLEFGKTYNFTIYDSSGDGVSSTTAGLPPGFYAISLNGTELARNVDFGSQQTTIFSTPAKPAPTICFSGESKVSVENRGLVSIEDIVLGDKVLVSGNKFEAVYSFDHRNVHENAEYIQIHSKGTNGIIEMSGAHMILSQNRWVPVSSLKVGDMITKADDSTISVDRLVTIVRKGAYAPFTKSGTIVVNAGVVASTYVAFQESAHLVIGGMTTPLAFQWLAHTFESGHRLACTVIDCSYETYTDTGISKWVAGPRRFGVWVLLQHPVVTSALLTPVLLVFTVLSIMEKYPFMFMIAFVAIAITCGRKSQQKLV